MIRKRGGPLVVTHTIAGTAISLLCNELFFIRFLRLEERGNRWLKV